MSVRIESGISGVYGGLSDRVINAYKTEKTDTSGWTIDNSAQQPHWKQLEGVKDMFFAKAGSGSKISEDIQRMKSSMESLADSFFEGKISEDELADRFQSLAESFMGACKEKQYPFPTLSGFDEAELSFAYDCFRGAILRSAVDHNNAEGKELCSKYNRGWHYYNADYYYMSESAVGAITGRVKSMAGDRGFDGFEIPDYKALGKNSLYNFNSAVSGESDYIPGGLRAVEDKWILDFDAVPPEGFKWFYEDGGNDGQPYFVGEGEDVEVPLPKSSVWAMYKDMMISDSFSYTPGRDQPSDLKNLGELLQFRPATKKEFAAINKFIGNFQLAPKLYFADKARRENPRRGDSGWGIEA